MARLWNMIQICQGNKGFFLHQTYWNQVKKTSSKNITNREYQMKNSLMPLLENKGLGCAKHNVAWYNSSGSFNKGFLLHQFYCNYVEL
jgi:hypothetical protein